MLPALRMLAIYFHTNVKCPQFKHVHNTTPTLTAYDLRRVSENVHLLGSRVRVPPRVWMSLSSEYCVFSGRGLCDGPIPLPEESYRVCVIECDQVQQQTTAPKMSR